MLCTFFFNHIRTLPFVSSNTFDVNGIQLDRDETRKGKILYDYDAENDGEMSVTADQVT